VASTYKTPKKIKKPNPGDIAHKVQREQKLLSKATRSALSDFDSAAQGWGYQSDQGVGSEVNRSFGDYQDSMLVLVRRIKRIEKKAKQADEVRWLKLEITRLKQIANLLALGEQAERYREAYEALCGGQELPEYTKARKEA
jgi:hypothetical protein